MRRIWWGVLQLHIFIGEHRPIGCEAWICFSELADSWKYDHQMISIEKGDCHSRNPATPKVPRNPWVCLKKHRFLRITLGHHGARKTSTEPQGPRNMKATQTPRTANPLEIPLNYHRCVSTLIPPKWVQWPPWAHSQPSPRIQGEEPNQPPARSGKNRDQKSSSREANETTTDLMKSHVFFVATHPFLKNMRVCQNGWKICGSWSLGFK